MSPGLGGGGVGSEVSMAFGASAWADRGGARSYHGCGGVFSLIWGGFFPNFLCYSGGIGSFSIGIFSLSRALLEGGSSL